MELVRVNKKSFDQQDISILFEEDDDKANNNFAIISNDTYRFKIAWNSEIEPVIKGVVSEVFSIGIDQHFSVIDFNTGNVLLNIKLFYNFYDTEIIENYILVISELEIIKIRISDLTVAKTYSLPDYFESIEFQNETISVNCIGNEVLKIES